MTEQLSVTCLSLISPVGYSPQSAVAAMRAGIDAFGELPYRDNMGEPIVGAAVPGVAPELLGRARIVELLALALFAARDRLSADRDVSLPLLLCTREVERPGPNLAGIIAEVEAKLRVTFEREGSAHIPAGAVSTFTALGRARRMLNGRDACLIAAVDTFVDPLALDWLDRSKRLKKEGHSDGVIPGEAACVALVRRGPTSPSAVVVRGVGFGQETATIGNDEPFRGDGMASAVRDALNDAGLDMHDIAFRFADVAGESYAFEEVLLAQLRNLGTARECQVLLHPAGWIGDTGAASGLIQLAWAEQAFARHYACGPLALALTSAPAGARAAAVLAAQPV